MKGSLQSVFWVALLSAGELRAQAIPTAPEYLPGRQYELRLLQTVEDARDNPPRKSYQTPITVRVLRRSTAGTELEWRAGKSTPLNTDEQPHPILGMVERIFEDLRLIVWLDAIGRYQALRNEAELRAKIQEFVLLLVPQATARIADPAERRRAADAMGKLLTPQALLSAARKEIDLYFGLSGLPLEVGKPLRIQSSVLNPFGDRGTLDGEMEIIPIDVDSTRNEAIVEFRQEFDPGESGSGVPGASPAVGGDVAPETNLTLTDSGEYRLDLSTGRVQQVRHVRTIHQDGQPVRVETTEIAVE